MTAQKPDWQNQIEEFSPANKLSQEDFLALKLFIKKVEDDAYDKGFKTGRAITIYKDYKHGFESALQTIKEYQTTDETDKQREKDAEIVKAAMAKLHGDGNARRILQGVYDQIINS